MNRRNYIGKTIAWLTLVSLSSLFSAQVMSGERNISKVLGSIDIADGERVGSAKSVNGGIDIGDDAVVDSAETVNGHIEIEDNVRIGSASTVNGAIEAGKNLTVTRSLSTVNGGISVKSNFKVGRDISSVNGGINLVAGTVDGDVSTNNGDVTLEKTLVKGDLNIRKNRGSNHSWHDESKWPTLSISKDSDIKGKINLYRPVHLKVENDALKAKIVKHFGEDED